MKYFDEVKLTIDK